MNPSVGRFITMDSYEGSIDDPVSLHKYLYCNSDPVNNYDPSGYNTLAEMEATTGIQGVLNQMITPNVKALMNLFDGLSAIWDIADTARTAWNDGLRGADLAISVACGVMTSILTNFSCQILALGPIGVALFAVGALVLGVGIGMALAEGDGSLALSRVAQLVGVLFAAFSPSCFTGDTEVYTSEGLVCIEAVQVGDDVWAYNSETGETELKKVLNVWIKETDEIFHISTSDGETIDTTTNHPFYVEEKGWVAAGDLDVGDILITADGSKVEITELELENLAEPISVYNLEVADFHTYFVGEYGVLVHNYKNEELDLEINVDDLSMSKTAAGHTDRKYLKYKSVIEDIMNGSKPIKDPGGLDKGWRWDTPGSVNGEEGVWELVVDLASNMIVHFLFKQGRK